MNEDQTTQMMLLNKRHELYSSLIGWGIFWVLVILCIGEPDLWDVLVAKVGECG